MDKKTRVQDQPGAKKRLQTRPGKTRARSRRWIKQQTQEEASAAPLLEQQTTTQQENPTPSELPAPQPGTKVLIVDDDPLALRILETLVERIGYQPVLCQNGIEALAALAMDAPPQFALIDWHMPEFDGSSKSDKTRATIACTSS